MSSTSPVAESTTASKGYRLLFRVYHYLECFWEVIERERPTQAEVAEQITKNLQLDFTYTTAQLAYTLGVMGRTWPRPKGTGNGSAADVDSIRNARDVCRNSHREKAERSAMKTPPLNHLCRISFVARETGQPYTSVTNAIDRGEIAAFRTCCGLRLVRLADAKKWAGQTRKRGPRVAG